MVISPSLYALYERRESQGYQEIFSIVKEMNYAGNSARRILFPSGLFNNQETSAWLNLHHTIETGTIRLYKILGRTKISSVED